MEPTASNRMMTPRRGAYFTTDEGAVEHGVSIPDTHPLFRQNRGQFIVAHDTCRPIAKPEESEKPKAKVKAKPAATKAPEAE